MLFNSLDFAIFLPIVFTLYWILGKDRIELQNGLLLISSFIFYGWWDWRFLGLMIISSSTDFLAGITLSRIITNKYQRVIVAISIIVNFGILFFFKYFNFFVASFVEAFRFFGSEIHSSSLKVILPVGISFYTFQSVSYTIAVYKKQLKPSFNIVTYFAYVSFFPQLVAGPIERAKNLLPQFL